jgi:PhnB protein
MKTGIHLTFDGRCEEALTFYGDVLGGSVQYLLRYADSPAAADVPQEWGTKIIHASFALGDVVIAASDQLPGQYRGLRGFYMMLSPPDVATSKRVFDALAQRGTVQMALGPTFWSEAFGVVVDRFGTPWEISCQIAPETAPK